VGADRKNMQTKQCLQCHKNFQLYPEDLEFCKNIKVPEPILCNDCSTQRRMCFRNERSLHKRKCDLCQQEVISIFSPDKPYQVYCNKCWWSDKWNILDTGQEVDFKRPFFQQINEVFQKTPLCNLVIASSDNSDYTNYAVSNNHSYLIFASDYNESCCYGSYIFKCRDCLDALFCNNCEYSYEIIDCDNCYGSRYLQSCKQCTDCAYCYDCQSCNNCFGCIGLRHKNYHIYNKEYSPAEYQKWVKTHCNASLQLQEFTKLKLKYPHRFAYNSKCTNSFGDYLSHCEDCKDCYDLIEGVNCRYTTLGLKPKDCFRCTGVPNAEYSYESVGIPEDNNIKFSLLIWPRSSYLEYCYFCRASNNCFGCVSLHKNEYCILNKQYSEQSFDRLRIKIIEHMRRTGEYGQYLSTQYSPFAYNETAANDYYPLTKEEVLAKGWKWHESLDKEIDNNLPVCKKCQKNFSMIAKEREFYQKHDISLPELCPNCRHLERLKKRNPRSLWHRQCQRPDCHNTFETTYSPERKELVYCEDCYNKEIY